MYTYTTTCHQVSFLAGLNEDLALVRQMCKHLHYGATIKNKKKYKSFNNLLFSSVG